MKATKKWLCATDSYENALALAKEFPDAVLITKDWKGEVPDFDNYDRIIYSPKVIYGIDSTMEREVFVCYHERTITPPEMYQQLSRCRNILGISYFFMRKQYRKSNLDIDNIKLQMIEDNKCGCKYFKNVWGGDHFNAFFEICARFEYDDRAYKSNPFAHFKAILHEKGVKDENVYEVTASKRLKDIKKGLKDERHASFNITDAQFEKLLKILKVPMEDSAKYAEFFLDSTLMTNHWNVCNYFFKDTDKVFTIFNKKCEEFLLKKVKQPKMKLKFMMDLKAKLGCPDPCDIQINQGFSKEDAEIYRADYISIFSSKAKDLDFTNAYCIQKLVVQAYRTMFGKNFVSSTAIKTKTNRDCYKFGFVHESLARHNDLYQSRRKGEEKQEKKECNNPFEDSDEESI
eukprot:SAG11_NODE_1807_length_4228_cov_3.662146_5_plen_402_part_00